MKRNSHARVDDREVISVFTTGQITVLVMATINDLPQCSFAIVTKTGLYATCENCNAGNHLRVTSPFVVVFDGSFSHQCTVNWNKTVKAGMDPNFYFFEQNYQHGLNMKVVGALVHRTSESLMSLVHIEANSHHQTFFIKI